MTRGLGSQMSPEWVPYAAALGSILAIMLRDPARQRLPISALAAWIRPALTLEQYRIFFDDDGRPVGFAIWAYLSDDVQEKWQTQCGSVLHISEWNEGENLWLVDFCALKRYQRIAMEHVKAELFSACDAVNWVRRKPNGQLKHVVCKLRRGH